MLVATFSAVVALGALEGFSGGEVDARADTSWPAVVASADAVNDTSWPVIGPEELT
ncbi:hypothetical protein K8369_38385 [Streptomyces sp. PSKA30]|nr:hypothetical protein [Streptomyces sp. PSKA30]